MKRELAARGKRMGKDGLAGGGAVGVKCAGYVDGWPGRRAGRSHSLSDVMHQADAIFSHSDAL